MSSRYFVVGAFASEDPDEVRRVVKRANRRFSMERRKATEFSFHHETEKVRRYLLSGVSKSTSWIAWAAVNKRRSRTLQELEWHEIYDGMCGDVLNMLAFSLRPRYMEIVVDKFYSKSKRRSEFDQRIIREIRDNWSVTGEINIRHSSSNNSECLQMQDCIVGSIFSMLERGNASYYDMIKNQVIASNLIE